MALALGVGQSRSSSVRFPPLDRVPEQARGVGQLVSFADGKDEQPFALVGRADFRRREEACRKAVAHADQSAGDFGEAEAEMMGDIFEEDDRRIAFPDDAGNVRPEMARIGLAVICALGIGVSLRAQSPATGRIIGRIFNPATQEYVRHAEIAVDGTNLTTVSGDDGSYVLSNIPAGNVSVSVTYTGYDRASSQVVLTVKTPSGVETHLKFDVLLE